jgi:EAL domain-containing protein (putative c-di-GMP-specific phosphodiesterase class I)
VSPVQLKTAGKQVRGWLQTLRDSPLPGEAYVIEITEGLLMEQNTKVLQHLLEFRDLAIEVAIDDFGTGYSSLSYLHKFDIDYLKIDQSFVSSLNTEKSSLGLCEAIIQMAHKLELAVIAEGVETAEQALALKKMGCDYAQGYLFSKPVDAVTLSKMLEQDNYFAELLYELD